MKEIYYKSNNKNNTPGKLVQTIQRAREKQTLSEPYKSDQSRAKSANTPIQCNKINENKTDHINHKTNTAMKKLCADSTKSQAANSVCLELKWQCVELVLFIGLTRLLTGLMFIGRNPMIWSILIGFI